jgi:hypothetical protein
MIGIVWWARLAEPLTLLKDPKDQRASPWWSIPFFGLAIWFGLLFVSRNCRPLNSERAGAGSRTTGRGLPGLILLVVFCLAGAVLSALPMLNVDRGDFWAGVLRLDRGDLWAGAQYGAAVWVVLAILLAYWNCFEIYWDLIWHCPVLERFFVDRDD